jgi:prophage endopeptidase
MNLTPFRLALLALIAVLVAWFAFDQVRDDRDSARRERDAAQHERDGLRGAARITGERLAQAAANDLKHTRELADARNQNLSLRRAVDAGHRRLLVNATCPAALPTDASAAGMADAGAAELSADARPDYFTLRDQLDLSRRMILGLQDHARLCQR